MIDKMGDKDTQTVLNQTIDIIAGEAADKLTKT